MEKKTLKSFKDLLVWQKVANLAIRIYKTTDNFPRSEIYGLSNQMRRAVISISSNIAEGFKRIHQKEKSQFYNTAYSSVAELESQTEISRELGFLLYKDYQELYPLLVEVSKMMDGLIQSLNSKSYILYPRK
ncbi:MAG: four helix bundle protein [Patescibacteria group bacterium]